MHTPVLDLFRPGFHLVCRAYLGLALRGVEHIPSRGALIVAPNHQTYADPPLVTIPIRRPVHYMAWNRLFHIPLFGAFIRRLRAFPVDVDMADSRATREVVRLLQAGQVVMIFPEARRSPDGRVGRFKPGAFRLAASLDVPVLPVSIAGGHRSWPPHALLPRPGRITITYHPPAHPHRGGDPREAARELLTRVRSAILSELPEEARSP